MGIPVAISPPLIVLVIKVTGCNPVNGLLEIVDHTALEFDGAQGRRGTRDEERYRTIPDSRFPNSFTYQRGNVNDIRFSGCMDRKRTIFKLHSSGPPWVL